MKGVRFYQDANGGRPKSNPHKWKKDMPDGCNGLALFPEHTFRGKIEGTAALYAGPGDGPYNGTSVEWTYLNENCRRISEAEARKQFPNLLKYLEA